MTTGKTEADFLGNTPVDPWEMHSLLVKMADRIRQLEAELSDLRTSTKKLIPRGDVYIGKA